MTTKTVQVISRIEFKADSRKVVYKVRPSKGGEPYVTILFDGKCVSCTCPATQPCYHGTQLEQKEATRHLVAEAQDIVTAVTKCDESYEQWKCDNGLDGKLSREAFCTEFSIY